MSESNKVATAGAIPLVDVKAQNQSLRGELDAAVRAVVDAGAFILGPGVERFEKAFAAHTGVRHAIGVQSGTAALQLALMALGVGPGDEVVTTPMSFTATAAAITHVGARPVFVDVEEGTLNLDVARVEPALTARTKAILPVHLYGQPVNMGPLLELARRRGIPVLEDACQAHGATIGEKRAGSLGRAGCFSFYPGKNLGAWGEGGAVTTDDPALAEKIRLLRDHGSPEKYRHVLVGFNLRLEGIQGAVLDVKLPHLDRWNARRRVLADRYRALLAGAGDVRCVAERAGVRSSNHLFVVRTVRREQVFAELKARNVACAIHYPTPIHRLEAYAGLGLGPGSFPITEAATGEILSLPLYPELTEEQQDRVVAGVRAGVGRG